MTEMDDVLKDRLNSLKADRDRTKAAGTSKTAPIPSHPDRSCVAGKDVLERAVLPSRNGAIPGSQMSLSGAPEEIRTPDPQIRSPGRSIEFVGICYRKNCLAQRLRW
jgi:hypothetical protein